MSLIRIIKRRGLFGVPAVARAWAGLGDPVDRLAAGADRIHSWACACGILNLEWELFWRLKRMDQIES